MSNNKKESINTTSDDVQKSVAEIYAGLLEKRRKQKEINLEEKRLKKEAEQKEREDQTDQKPMTRKEKEVLAIGSWINVITELTGEDLEYIPRKKNKKKYREWIGDEIENTITVAKPEKKKKKNYSKEFEPELNMLKTIVTEQNKFTADLQKRYAISAGPNTKDSMPLNKTLVELAAVINSSRGNSLSVLREIGNLKKTIADLYMKQKKLDSETGSSGFGSQDLGLTGSDIASSIFNTPLVTTMPPQNVSYTSNQQPMEYQPPASSSESSIQQYNPEEWDGGGIVDNTTHFESIPHSVIVEWHKDSDKARFKAIRDDTNEEITGYPLPTCTIRSIDEKNKIAKDDFDQIYRIEIVE